MASNSLKTDFEIGWSPALGLNLIPVLRLTFDPPPQTLVDSLRNSTAPDIEFPITGKCPGLPANIRCVVTWKIKTSEGILTGGNVNAKFKKTAEGEVRIVDENDKVLKINLFKEKVVGKGILGYSVAPVIPYHEPVENFPEKLTFENMLDLELSDVTSAKIGQKVGIKIKTGGIFKNADVKLVIIENDKDEFENKAAVGVQHTWKKGDSQEWVWAIGFGDGGYGVLTYPEPRESGEFEYNFSMAARTAEKDEYIVVRTFENIIKKVMKPKLVLFSLEYASEKKGFTLNAKGSITGFAPGTQFRVGVHLLRNEIPGERPPEVLDTKKCEAFLQQNGDFVIPIESVSNEKNKKNIDEYMALLYLPQLGNENVTSSQHCAPVGWVINYDYLTFAPFDGKKVAPFDYGKWLFSREFSKKHDVRKLLVSPAEAKVRAFMRMVRVGEGTVGEGGYEKLFGGQSFIKDYKKDWTKHPDIKITRKTPTKTVTSTAAGAYQILSRVWDGLLKWRTQYGITDFTPLNQDKAMVTILKHKRGGRVKGHNNKYAEAYGDIVMMIIKDDFQKAALTASLEWSSLPDGPYGKGLRTREQIKADYEKYLEEELNMKTDLHIEYGFLKTFGYSVD
jgi:muramidase (phage lysozyme)